MSENTNTAETANATAAAKKKPPTKTEFRAAWKKYDEATAAQRQAVADLHELIGNNPFSIGGGRYQIGKRAGRKGANGGSDELIVKTLSTAKEFSF